MEEVTKGGESYLRMSVDRTSKGMEIFVKVHPDVEKFLLESSGGQLDALDAFGRNWYSPEGAPLKAYRMEQMLNGVGFHFGNLCGGLQGKAGTNLSWLQLQGISRPEGLSFIVTGPVSRQFVIDFPKAAGQAAREFFKNYIVPIHVNLNLSTQELT